MATAPFGSGPQNKQETENLVTLLIKHLPDAIPQDNLSRLFSHYGASSVRPCSAGRYIVLLNFSFYSNLLNGRFGYELYGTFCIPNFYYVSNH